MAKQHFCLLQRLNKALIPILTTFYMWTIESILRKSRLCFFSQAVTLLNSQRLNQSPPPPHIIYFL